MDKLSQKLEKVHADMATAAEELASDPSTADKLTELDATARQLQGEHDELEMAWLEAAEKREG